MYQKGHAFPVRRHWRHTTLLGHRQTLGDRDHLVMGNKRHRHPHPPKVLLNQQANFGNRHYLMDLPNQLCLLCKTYV